MTSRRIALALALTVVLGTSACTTVPDSSAPQTVQPVPLDHGAGASGPKKGASARQIVEGFLDASVSDPINHTTARAYLTPAAATQWSDQRVTIVNDQQVPTFDADRTGQVSGSVTGKIVGTISNNGIYEPSLTGTGGGGASTSFRFTLKRVNGQYRIASLRSGLLISETQFLNYTQHSIYFYDLADHSLVSDVRWTAIPITSPAALATWLVQQLVSGPRPELQDAVSTDTFPTQANPDSIVARGDSDALSISIPGSSQLDAAVRDRLALQIARTLDNVAPSGRFSITDNSAPVTIPEVGASSFTAASFPPAPTVTQSPKVYYLDNGRIFNADGTRIAGPLGNGSFYLTSFAVAHRGSSAALAVAAVASPGGNTVPQLYVGSTALGVRPTTLKGTELTRPAWAPGRSEVWIGSGSTLHRLTVSGETAVDHTVPLPPAVGGGRIQSVRLSPDGQQIAIVFAGSGSSQGLLKIGAVARDSNGVRVSGLAQVNPQGVTVTDADWTTSLRLIAIGYLTSSRAPSVFELGADGSIWRNLGIDGLPSKPDNITASPNGAWAEAQNQVWVKAGDEFSSASPLGSRFGHVPVYLSG